MRESARSLNALLALLAAFVFVTYGLPFLSLIGMAFNIKSPYELGDIFVSYRLSCVLRSAMRAFVVSAIAVLVGFVIGTFLQRLSRRWRRWVLVSFVLPFLASDVCRAFAFRVALGRSGPVNHTLAFLGFVSEPIDWLLFSEFAVALAQFVNAFPFALFPLFAAISNLDPQVYRIADQLGVGRIYSFRKITFPLIFPAVAGSFLITFSVGLGATVEVDFLSSTRCSLGDTVTALWRASRFELASVGGLLAWLINIGILWLAFISFRKSLSWMKA